MSHKATNWAVTVRGIDPTCKVILWHLADRHNKETGRCDPSQELLASDCEIGRATLNRKMKYLEQAGLIERVQRSEGDTKRKKTTFYKLRFDRTRPQDMESLVSDRDMEAVSQIEQKPCLKSGESRVSDWDINLGREPGREPCAAESAANKGFEEFFGAHPRPVKREETFTAYLSALDAGVSPEWILSSARKYANEQEGNQTRWITMSSTWLEESRWSDFPFSQPKPTVDIRTQLINAMNSPVPAVREDAEKKWRNKFPTENLPMEAAE